MPSTSPSQPAPESFSDTKLLGELLAKMQISNDSLLEVVGDRILKHQRTQAEEIWRLLTLRGESKAARLASQLGKAVSAQEFCGLLGYSKSGVHKAKTENRLLAFRLPGDTMDLFPLFQVEKGKVLTWIPLLLGLIGNGLPVVHFLGVHRKSLGGASFSDLLRQGNNPKMIESMLKRAENMGNAAAEGDFAPHSESAAKTRELEPA
jgi:hypothetical protein